MLETPPNQRRKARFLSGLSSALRFGGREFTCRATDLNRSGVMLEGEFPPPPDAQVEVVLRSTAGDLELIVFTRVAHAHAADEDGVQVTRVGLQFLEIDDEQGAVLDALVARVIEGVDLGEFAELPRDASLEDVRKALAHLPIAHRMKLAQRADRDQRELLRQDENMQVIEALARNPHITQAEIVSILRTMLHLLPTTLEVISRDPRWASNEELKIMVATHPRATLATAERLVDTLSLLGLRKIIRKPGLNPAIKNKILSKVPRNQLEGW